MPGSPPAATSSDNPLKSNGRPLFFKVGNVGALGISAPAIRLDDSIRVCARNLSVMQKEALVLSGRTGAMWRLASDEGAYLAGQDEAPCPLAFFSTGMVSSYMNEILALAGQRGIAIDNVRLVQDNYYTMRGSALKGTMVGGARNVHLTAQIASRSPQQTLAQLVIDATMASPINGLLRGSRESLFTLTRNGTELKHAGARPVGRFAETDPGDRMEAVRPAPTDWSGLIKRGGITPKAEHSTTLTNDSLSDEQNRLLHVRAICTLRDDGVKQIEQHLYNPHGSIFYFLSDESPESGGHGLAPDAISYASTGIAFCFMTQLGRYAKIARKSIQAYRIIQDAHFSLGGASGETGVAGRADPVETHVYLDTSENEDFARTALAMSEQTCFLHALCRSDLKVKVSIQPYSESGLLPAPLSSLVAD
ncbi:MAG: OsmC family peroxiredoxin [Steroidobacteraceae bacterium]